MSAGERTLWVGDLVVPQPNIAPRKVHAGSPDAREADRVSASAAPSVVKRASTTARVPSKAARWVDKRIAIR